MADNELIVWLDTRYSLVRSYCLDLEGQGCSTCNVTWKLSFATDYGTYSLTISGSICQEVVDDSLIAIEKIHDEESYRLSKYFTEFACAYDECVIYWNPENNTFEQETETDRGSCLTKFPFPVEGFNALVADMTNLLKELKWI